MTLSAFLQAFPMPVCHCRCGLQYLDQAARYHILKLGSSILAHDLDWLQRTDLLFHIQRLCITKLDLTIPNQQNQLIFDIRILQTHYLIVHINSCHICKHNKSAINYLIDRINTYSITHQCKYNQLQTITPIRPY
jgi:hypothetical protein